MVAILLASLFTPADRTLNVFAAASLKEAFTSLSRKYESANPGLRIRLNFAGSQALAAQINHGASADVFASAAAKNLGDISYDKASYRIFVLNKLRVAVRKGQTGIYSLADLSRVRNLVVADPSVPVGRYTEAFFAKASAAYGPGWLRSIRSHIVSREADVKAVLAKVRLGEADAGIVYASDIATAKGAVREIAIPDSLNQVAEYPIAIPTYAENRDDAKHFIKFLLDASSQQTLERSGFISITKAVDFLTMAFPGNEMTIRLPFKGVGREAVVQATDGKKVTRSYRGVLFSSLPGLSGATSASFVGADRYTQTVKVAELKSRKAILVRGTDGNYQLIVPGMKPSVWVNWLRRIELR